MRSVRNSLCRSIRSYSTRYPDPLNYHLQHKEKLCKKLEEEKIKIKEHTIILNELTKEIDITIKEVSQYCHHIWGTPVVTGTREYTRYCVICGVNDDYETFGVKVYN